ncbi:PDZ domain-containing protein [Mariniblastus fucicola]|uniref:PDZ domain (Also known as DHR or GLGF) n=1 Tax=Mariniblastus fucicola TaxID=980251 RepID=A0A5B9P9C8_9BACT|nr:PDZ domain-containing protein [Mariniblastus fucicola]QEG22954.1 PDZ domain (Also known as DHR or GLGF) [Mariniblastus fucicola]
MKTQIKNLISAIVVTCVLSSAGFAQQMTVQQPAVQVEGGQAQAFVQPRVLPYVQPPMQQNQFYFGMRVVLKRDGWGRTSLRVVDVTPGSPAQRAGLEFGDEIRRVNGRGFKFANNSFDAVRMINQYVANSGIGGPAGPGAPAMAVMVSPLPSPTKVARMVVRNVRTGHDVVVNVYPTRIGGGGGGAPAAAAMSAGG